MLTLNNSNTRSFHYFSQKLIQLTFVAFLSQSLLFSHPHNEALGFKIFGFDLSRLASLRAPPSRPSYQPRPTYQEIPEPPLPQIEPQQEYAYRQPEYNSVYSDQFVSPPQTKQDVYNSPINEPASYVEHQPLDYQYDYQVQGNVPTYDTPQNTYQAHEPQDVQDLPPSPVYVPSQHSNPVYATVASSQNNNVQYSASSYTNNGNPYAASYNQGQVDYSDYQELEIITAPTVKSRASVYGGQNTFDVKVGAGFHTSTR